MHVAWLVMWCVVDAGKRSEIGARKYTPSFARFCLRGHDAVVLLSDITIVWSVKLIFGIGDLESHARCCTCVSSASPPCGFVPSVLSTATRCMRLACRSRIDGEKVAG